MLLASLASVLANQPADQPARLEAWSAAQTRLDQLGESPVASSAQRKAATAAVKDAKKQVAPNPLSAWLGKMSQWSQDPRTAFQDSKGRSVMAGLAVLFAAMGCLFGLGAWTLGRPVGQFIPGFIGLSLLAVLAQLLADQELIKHYNLEYALWALLVGMIISNTVGTPKLLMSAVATEFYIKTGLVLLGAEVLFQSPVGLGAAGHLRGVGRDADRADLHLHLRAEGARDAVPLAQHGDLGRHVGLRRFGGDRHGRRLQGQEGRAVAGDRAVAVVHGRHDGGHAGRHPSGRNEFEILGGAWMGGTIDSTGAVAAAGGLLGNTALEVAATVKMIQNILIGVIGVRRGGLLGDVRGARPLTGRGRSLLEIWRRFPQVRARALSPPRSSSSILYSTLTGGPNWCDAMIAASEPPKRCAAGSSAWRSSASAWRPTSANCGQYLSGGKPLILYVCGQSLNLLLTLLMAWLMFEKVFPDAAASLTP